MDKVVLVDFHNAVWRASIGFGPPRDHGFCDHSQPKFYDLKHPTADTLHCICGAKWDAIDHKCYGEKYVFVFNFFRNLRPLIEEFSPDKCYFVLEGKPQFRYDLFPDYKANRLIKQAAKQKDMDKFHATKNEILRLIQYLPIAVARAADYEADDVIGSLCENMKDEDLTVISNDSDFIQLLQRGYHNLTIYNPIKKVVMEVPSYPYVAWKCLNGDKSDNIPALMKPKKALEAVQNPEVFQKWMALEENRANFSINRQLIEFRQVPEEDIVLQEGTRNYSALKNEFAAMDFQSIINDKSWERYTATFDCLRY